LLLISCEESGLSFSFPLSFPSVLVSELEYVAWKSKSFVMRSCCTVDSNLKVTGSGLPRWQNFLWWYLIMWGSSICNLLYVTLLRRVIFRWLLDFLNIYAPLDANELYELHDEFCKMSVRCLWVFTFLINENRVMSKKTFSCDPLQF
jgi:hypothetical protein